MKVNAMPVMTIMAPTICRRWNFCRSHSEANTIVSAKSRPAKSEAFVALVRDRPSSQRIGPTTALANETTTAAFQVSRESVRSSLNVGTAPNDAKMSSAITNSLASKIEYGERAEVRFFPKPLYVPPATMDTARAMYPPRRAERDGRLGVNRPLYQILHVKSGANQALPENDAGNGYGCNHTQKNHAGGHVFNHADCLVTGRVKVVENLLADGVRGLSAEYQS